MNKKLLYLFFAWLLLVPSLVNASVFYNAVEKELNCDGGNLHLIKPYNFWNKESSYFYWSCNLAQTNTTVPYKCLTYVYSGTSENDEVIQVNPEETFIESVGSVRYFESQGDIALVYFTEKNLYMDKQYLYKVECFTEDGLEYGTYEHNVTAEYLSLGNIGAVWVFGISNVGFIIGIIMFIVVLFIFYKIIFK